MAIDIVDVVRLAKTNRVRYKRLLECEEELDQRSAEEHAVLLKTRQALYDEALVPFRDVFQRLKRVDLIELAAIERPTVNGEVGIKLRRPRRSAVPAAAKVLVGGALLVGVPLVVGHVAKAGPYRAVQTFGSASTGRRIEKLHGAAKSSATDAWFGRGPVAAGGGGTAAGKRILSKIETTSANLSWEAIAQWQTQTLRDGQQAKAQDLERREAKTKTRQESAPALYERSRHMQHVLQDLRSELVRRLPSLTALVEACDDFTQCDSRQRAAVAAMADLDGLAVMVMNCPITDAEGRMTEESGRVVADAEARLRAMETEL
ncbi:hypothetical protein AB0K49_04685 [Streptomyces decoyicus]|uniref:hypothetical protein n=1 Tax=Streptomyces decoyicus TaxID=249567 RepID=UPI00345DCFE4